MGKRTGLFIALAITAAVLVAGCHTATGQKTSRLVDDAGITASVKTKLTADRLANLTKVDVDTKDGVVTLQGRVDTPEQKAKAEEIARKTDHVVSVVNNIRVDGSPSASPATPSPAPSGNR